MATIGEYVKTKAAQAEADSHFRKMLNNWLKDGELKLVKFARGKKGTLNYGRYVIMMVRKIDPKILKVFPKRKPQITIVWGDFGLIARFVSHKIENMHWKFYYQKSAAEKKYQSEVRSAQR